MEDSNVEIQSSMDDCLQDFQYLTEIKAFMIAELQQFNDNGVLKNASPYDKSVGLISHYPDGREVRTLFTHGHEWSLKHLLSPDGDNKNNDAVSPVLKFYGFFGRHLPEKEAVRNTTKLVWSISDYLDEELQDHPLFISRCFAETKDKMWYDFVLVFDDGSEPTWRNSRLHSFAARKLAPNYYSSVRLHSGYLPAGIAGDKLHVKQTVFLDYTGYQKDSCAPIKRSVKHWIPEDLKTTVPYLDIYQQ